MKKIFFLLITLAAFTPLVNAQKSIIELKKKMTLQMPGKSYDDFGGTRGAAVAWHPRLKLYYASYSGNAKFPMAVFDKKGNRISDDDLTTQMDTRGLWYNEKTKQIEGNGYDDFGWFYYELDKKGMPVAANNIFYGMNQPESQSFGMYYPSANQVFFKSAYEDFLTVYDRETADEIEKINLILDDNVGDKDFSAYRGAFIITDKKGGEIGLLDDLSMQIDFFSIKTKKLTRSAKLPEGTRVTDINSFAYANGYIWILDDETRAWTGFEL